MAVDISKFVRTSQGRPHVSVIYGVPGIGKTTFASNAPDCVFLMTEDGLMSPHLQTQKYLAAKGHKVASYEEMMGWLESLAETDHGFKTVVIDSISAFEPLVDVPALKHANSMRGRNEPEAKALSDVSFGRGPETANVYWLDFMRACQRVRDAGISVILIGHSVVRKIAPPDTAGYDRYELQVRKQAAALIIQEADNVFFARKPVATKAESNGFTEKHRAIGTEGRRLFCEEAATHVAKNRCDMPSYIDMEWPLFAESVPFMKAPAKSEKKSVKEKV